MPKHGIILKKTGRESAPGQNKQEISSGFVKKKSLLFYKHYFCVLLCERFRLKKWQNTFLVWYDLVDVQQNTSASFFLRSDSAPSLKSWVWIHLLTASEHEISSLYQNSCSWSALQQTPSSRWQEADINGELRLDFKECWSWWPTGLYGF